MTGLLEIINAKPKGLRREPRYIPEIGEACRASGPNCDDDKGYVFLDVTVLWRDDIFVLYRHADCWPVLYKLEHVLFEPG